MIPDWRRIKAVVFESDDWGLCAWSPDEQAHRVLTDTPAFRSPAGQAYGRSTLESAGDVERLVATLLEFRGGDGFPPVWQANTVVASPDYARLKPPLFEADALPLLFHPEAPSRWQRPGLWTRVRDAREAGVWWPELHGLTHLPEHAWLTALRRNRTDARRAFDQQSPVCEAVEASGELDPTEPRELRERNLARAVLAFERLFGRMPLSLCPPDYRWDDAIEEDAEKIGITTWQGRAERNPGPIPMLHRMTRKLRWQAERGVRFYLPPRIAFEPRGAVNGSTRVGVAGVHRRVHEAWAAGRPAVVSTHRLNYAHLDPKWSEAGRASLRDLLGRLAMDGAVFLTDDEVRQIHQRGWSVRPIGSRGALVRYHSVPRLVIRIPAPAGTFGVRVREGRVADASNVVLEGGAVTARLEPGEVLLEWSAG